MPESLSPSFSNRVATVLMAALLLLGLYFPTSIGETISVPLYLLNGAMLLSILMVLLARRGGVLGMPAVLNAGAINVILVVFTLFSGFTEFAYGGWVPIFLCSIQFCVSVRDIRLTAAMRRLFDATNAINIVLAILLLLRTPSVTQFFLEHYAYAYEELLPYMLDEGKPVLTFGSHSLAGFFFYLLFYLTFRTFAITRSKLNLLFALCYVALLTCLYSFTSLVFVTLAAAQVIGHFQWHKSVVAGLVVTAFLLVGAVVVAPRLDSLNEFKEDMVDVMNREDNGLLGRYSQGGGLSANLAYIAEHPFRPIGLGYSQQLWYADSGPVEYFLKGSFPLVFSIYVGALAFFLKNLKSRRRAIFIFGVFLGFELGYTNLQYVRTQCFLPFLLVYLNGLEQTRSSSSAGIEGISPRWQHA